MGYPKRKNDIQIYKGKKNTDRRQELLDRITKSDTNLPEPILHDDLDLGMLEFVGKNFKVVSDGEEIPIIKKILTIQRWGEFTNNWEFSDDDNNMKLPFIAVIRKPEVLPGTNPANQRTIPERRNFHYATVSTWDGNQVGADIYKIPQPIAVDLSYEVTIVCTKFRELNKFNAIVMKKFASRQAYTSIKGHYIPILYEGVDDSSPIDLLDGRRFYIQTYKFLLLGLLLDEDEFEVKPAINRVFIMQDFIKDGKTAKKLINPQVNTVTVSLTGNGTQTQFSVGELIGQLFVVSINGIVQEKDIQFYHINTTSNITFVSPPLDGDNILITYLPYKHRYLDTYGAPLHFNNETFEYDGSSLIFTTSSVIKNIIYITVNGIIDIENVGYLWSTPNTITMEGGLVNPSYISILYSY